MSDDLKQLSDKVMGERTQVKDETKTLAEMFCMQSDDLKQLSDKVMGELTQDKAETKTDIGRDQDAATLLEICEI